MTYISCLVAEKIKTAEGLNMAVSLAMAIVTSDLHRFPFLSSMVTTSSAPTSVSDDNFSKIFIRPRRRRSGFHVEANSRLRSYEFKSKKNSKFQKQKGATWEDPDDGSGSEYDEEDEDDDDEELGFESDWEGEKGISTSGIHKYEVDLVKEVEQLLKPEERAILQQNVTPDLGKISTGKWSPIHTLGLSGQIQDMDKLLANGLDVDMVDKDGFTALHKAIIGKKEPVISHLLRKGASPHLRDQDGATPLHYAVQVGAMQTVKLLIKYDVDVNVADNEGWTPLHIAMQSRSRNIAKVLLVNGADKTRKNKTGKTPLDLSLCYGKDFKSYDLAKLLKLVPANRDL